MPRFFREFREVHETKNEITPEEYRRGYDARFPEVENDYMDLRERLSNDLGSDGNHAYTNNTQATSQQEYDDDIDLRNRLSEFDKQNPYASIDEIRAYYDDIIDDTPDNPEHVDNALTVEEEELDPYASIDEIRAYYDDIIDDTPDDSKHANNALTAEKEELDPYASIDEIRDYYDDIIDDVSDKGVAGGLSSGSQTQAAGFKAAMQPKSQYSLEEEQKFTDDLMRMLLGGDGEESQDMSDRFVFSGESADSRKGHRNKQGSFQSVFL